MRAWLGSKLKARGYDAAKLDTASPYQIPHNVVALGARYSIEELADLLNAIAVWFSNGNAMLNAIRDGLVSGGSRRRRCAAGRTISTWTC